MVRRWSCRSRRSCSLHRRTNWPRCRRSTRNPCRLRSLRRSYHHRPPMVCRQRPRQRRSMSPTAQRSSLSLARIHPLRILHQRRTRPRDTRNQTRTGCPGRRSGHRCGRPRPGCLVRSPRHRCTQRHSVCHRRWPNLRPDRRQPLRCAPSSPSTVPRSHPATAADSWPPDLRRWHPARSGRSGNKTCSVGSWPPADERRRATILARRSRVGRGQGRATVHGAQPGTRTDPRGAAGRGERGWAGRRRGRRRVG